MVQQMLTRKIAFISVAAQHIEREERETIAYSLIFNELKRNYTSLQSINISMYNIVDCSSIWLNDTGTISKFNFIDFRSVCYLLKNKMFR